MAKKSESHKKLINDAKKLGIKSPHLFGEDKLKSKIVEAGKAKNGSGSQGGKITPTAKSEVKAKETPNDEGKGNSPKPNDPEAQSSADLGDAKKVNLKEGEGYLYHETEKPRVFKDEEEVPEGWNMDNRKLWILGDYGEFVNVNG